MKITTKNYFSVIAKYEEDLPEGLDWALTYLLSETKEGKDWSRYKTDKKFKEVADLSFQKLEEYLAAKANKRISKPAAKGKQKSVYSKYANIDTECRFIERFLGFHDQVLYKNTFGIFIDELQTAIFNHKITKKSPVAKEITQIQAAAVKQFNSMYNAAHFVLKPATIKHLKSILEKRENAYDDINVEYAKSKRDSMPLEGIQAHQTVNVMPSTEFASLHFNTIGFKDRWLAFIGDPAPGFTAMVFGMPKMGKSYLCMDFAGYLARNHGKVLYVAKEEKLDKTLQDKVIEKEVAHPNLTVADGIPPSLAEYDFIFLDSVNKLGLTPKDLEQLKADNKGKSFIYVFQATKSGSFKGNNEFQHDVDVVIEVPEKGKAIQYGRFNQGGETEIFPVEKPEIQVAGLNGPSKKKEKDWTEAKGLMEGDKYFLKQIKKCVDQGDFEGAKDWAYRGETEVREAIPGEIWLKMGGTLTPTGWEKLRKRGFTEKEIKELRKPQEEEELEVEEESEPKIREISLMYDSKPKSYPTGADIYENASSLREINYALRGLQVSLEGQVMRKFKVGEYLDIVRIAVRKHPELFPFTEHVSEGLKDILFRLRDSWEDYTKGVTPDSVKPMIDKPRAGNKIHFPPSPGIDALAIYYDNNVKEVNRDKFDSILTESVEKDDLLYYNLHELERVFSRVLYQIKRATSPDKQSKL